MGCVRIIPVVTTVSGSLPGLSFLSQSEFHDNSGRTIGSLLSQFAKNGVVANQRAVRQHLFHDASCAVVCMTHVETRATLEVWSNDLQISFVKEHAKSHAHDCTQRFLVSMRFQTIFSPISVYSPKASMSCFPVVCWADERAGE